MDLQQLKIERDENPYRRRSGWGGVVAWVIVLALVGSTLWLFRVPLMNALNSVRLPEVGVVQVSQQSSLAAAAVSGTSSNGYVVASKRAALSADTPGRIVELNVIEGSIVKKGQVVARLYSKEYEAALDRANAELGAQQVSIERARAQADAARADLPRLTAEIERATSSESEQRAGLELARVNMDRAEKLLAEKVGAQQSVDDARTTLVRVQAALQSATAGVAAARAAHAQTIVQVNALEAAVREAQARLPVLQADIDQARATLDKTEVRAPFDGIVVLKDAEVGEVVSPNGAAATSRGSVATMVDWSSLEVQVELPETNLAAAVVGAAANIYLDAYPDRAYAGKVLRIWPTANRQKATVEVRVGFDKPDEFLRPEMGARVVFSPKAAEPVGEGAAKEPALLIPRSAVVPIDGADTVFVLERDIVRARTVTLGDERSGRVLVRSGLTPGERIVSTPPTSLKDGDQVRVKE